MIISLSEMADRNLVGAVRKSLDDLYNSSMPEWKKHQIMNRVGAMLNGGQYGNMTVEELREIAKQQGIRGYSKARKDVLLQALQDGWEEIPRDMEPASYQKNYQAQKLGRQLMAQQGLGTNQTDSANYNRVGQAYKSRDRSNYNNYNRVGQAYKSRELQGSRGRVGCGACSR